MRDIKTFIATVNERLKELDVRSEKVKQDSVAIGLELIEFVDEIKKEMPASQARNDLMSSISYLSDLLAQMSKKH